AAMLTGIGVGTGPGLLGITTNANMLGDEIVGTYGTDITLFTVTNLGAAPTGMLTLQPSGANPADFPVDDQCTSRTLAPATSCTFGVRFAPRERGTRTAIVEVSASPGGLVTGAVTGIGILPSKLVADSRGADFGTVRAGATSTATITVTNAGDVKTAPIN